MSEPKHPQNLFERLRDSADRFQRSHRLTAFPYGVMKKYDDDEGNYQAALIAYFGFLSLFPLLIIATAIIQQVSQKDSGLREQLLTSVTSYFPALGDNLAASIQSPSKTGLALALALLIMFYGARGVADAVQHALNHVWGIARPRREGFPKSLLRSFGIIVGGGMGFMLAALISGLATATGQPWPVRIILGGASLMVLFTVFWGIFTYGSSARHNMRANIDGAIFATFGLQALQLFGGYLINHQLKSMTGLNAQFAVVLAILFWLYLQARVFLYAVEINAVRYHRLWPRSINPQPPLPADEKAYALYNKRETFDPEVRIR